MVMPCRAVKGVWVTERFRLAIIGSGPAGLSAACHAARLGLSHVLLEKSDHLSDTIFKYQKGKHVMATPSALVLRAGMAFDAGKREGILGGWDAAAAECGVKVQYNAEVTGIDGNKDNFTIKLKNGIQVIAERIVFAIGTQGNPNLMQCPGGDLPHVQYQLNDPAEYVDEHITVVGAGDAGIENALGLVADPAQGNKVTIINRDDNFARSKPANVMLLQDAAAAGKLTIRTETTTAEVRSGEIVFDTRDGQETVRCDRIIARMGAAPPRKFIESCGIAFSGPDREAFPVLSAQFETSRAGIHVIGALAGYPLIKHCMNQGFDVVEFINGNDSLKPADEPILAGKFAALPGDRSVDQWLDLFQTEIEIFRELSALQLRELMLDSTVHAYAPGEVLFRRNEPGASLFSLAEGSVLVEIDAKDASPVS